MSEENIKIFDIQAPAIPSGSVYYFTTDNNIQYEVRFGRKQNSFFSATIVFGVLNEEYNGEEYVVTNKGDMYRVMATVVEVVKMYLKQHPNIDLVEFSGEPNKETNDTVATTRIKLYARYMDKIFGSGWSFEILGNKIVVTKKKK